MTADLAIKSRYRVGGMDCASCATKIHNAVSRMEGVDDVGVSVSAATLSVSHAATVPSATIERQVRALGYSIAPADGEVGANAAGAASSPVAEPKWWQSPKARLTLACGAALVVAYLVGLVLPEIGDWTFVLALAVGLVPVARRAIAAGLAGTPFSIETLMSIAAIGAVIIGATEEAATVVLLFLVGELLEGIAAGRARQSINGLSALVPKTALVESAGGVDEVPAAGLAVGSVILVRPGDRIAADGVVAGGASAVDEAPVTGESVLKVKAAGDAVFAGTINTDAVLRVRVTAAAADNTIARVVKLVEEAQESKAPTERFIDRFSIFYTPFVLVVGALVATVPPLAWGAEWGEWIYKGLAVLLIGCPCALVISTPAAVAAGLSAGARRGLLLKGGAVLENFRRVTAVALDKTGTLTQGRPVVTDVVPLARSANQIISMAAALETGSSHPLAQAILSRAKAEKLPVPPAFGASAVPGKGISGNVGGEQVFLGSPAAAGEMVGLVHNIGAQAAAFNDEGKTVSVLVVNSEIAGLVAMRDEPREDALAGLASLTRMGISTVMLTGDNGRTAQAIAGRLGTAYRAELLPQDKQRIVREMQAEGQVVAKVGDGINDAPALAAADIGIAMGGGTDVALETADAAALHGRVSDVADMINLSRRVMSNIWQNIALALGLKAVFLVTTILGITGLWPAILADTGATVLVTANAMRLLGWRGGRD